MDNHHLMLKVSHLFPSSFSSCHFRALPDVAGSSINLLESDLSYSLHKPPNPKKIPRTSSYVPRICKTIHSSDAPQFSTMKPEKMEQFYKERSCVVPLNHSSSSYSGWFTSSDEKTRVDDDGETDAFFSLCSNSGESFRLRTGRRFRSCEEMKSIDEKGRCSFSSVASFDTVLSRCSRKTSASGGKATMKGAKNSGKTWPKWELGSDHISTQLYYNNSKSAIVRSSRRRKTSKNRSSSRRSIDCSPVIGESYAVEKSSSDPRGDFRASMVEMIVEKQIFAAEDLERLLLCFLSLNAASYHGIIFDVFSEICQTLFTS